MEAIPSVIFGAARPPAVRAAGGAPRVRPAEDSGRPARPARDEYVPEERMEPSGRYWPGKDEDGQPRVYFDDPEKAADAPQESAKSPKAEEPEGDQRTGGPKEKSQKAERCTCNTDKVDHEIKTLKKKREELERQIHSETDETRARELETELARVGAELSQKDNDAYRRQHAVFS